MLFEKVNVLELQERMATFAVLNQINKQDYEISMERDPDTVRGRRHPFRKGNGARRQHE